MNLEGTVYSNKKRPELIYNKDVSQFMESICGMI